MIEKISEMYDRAKGYVADLAIHTKAEIVAGAVAGVIALGSLTHASETRRSLFQPVSYSEYEQLEDRARDEGRSLNELTWFYSESNDFSTKIEEAHNWNSIWSIIPEYHRDWFSHKLEQAMDTTGRLYRRNIRDLAREIPGHARGALRELSDLVSASQEGSNLHELFRETWDYGHTETGHFYPVTICTSNGKSTSCTTTMHYQCDFYHHTWTYNSGQGIRVSQRLIKAGQRVPEIKRIQIEVPTHTNAWNEQVIKQTFRKMRGREPTETEMLQAARFYKTGSQYELNIDEARSLWNHFISKDTETWQHYLSTARTTKKTTGCYSTLGPVEYEFAKDMQRRLESFIEHEQNITGGMVTAINGVPNLEHKIKVFILQQNPPMRGHYPELKDSELVGSPRKLANQVIAEAREMYKTNIPNGNEDTSYRLGRVFLFTLLGGVLGGLAGLGLDTLVDRMYYGISRKEEF